MDRRWARLLSLLATLTILLAGCAGSSPEPVTHAPRTINAIVGWGEDTTAINAFLPETLTIRAGDTVTWTIASDEPHTVTMLGTEPLPGLAVLVPNSTAGELMVNPKLAFPTRPPNAPVESYDGTQYLNSGMMSKLPAAPDQPPNDKFSATFTKPGLYKYVCALHGLQMTALVDVKEASVDVPSQEQIDAQVKLESETLEQRIASARDIGKAPRREPGPNNSTIHYVRAGGIDIFSTDERAQAYDFMPKDVQIKAGDTVVWASPNFHTVTFVPAPPDPEPFTIRPQEAGPPMLLFNPQVWTAAKPAATYDPTKYFNSADIGPFSAGGASWSLTFDKPGEYKYVCILHKVLGMEGTIIVQ
jgi:plastocyanin